MYINHTIHPPLYGHIYNLYAKVSDIYSHFYKFIITFFPICVKEEKENQQKHIYTYYIHLDGKANGASQSKVKAVHPANPQPCLPVLGVALTAYMVPTLLPTSYL